MTLFILMVVNNWYIIMVGIVRGSEGVGEGGREEEGKKGEEREKKGKGRVEGER